MIKILTKSHFQWQSFLAKTSAISCCDYDTLTCLGHLGRCNTNRNDSICVMSHKVAKASSHMLLLLVLSPANVANVNEPFLMPEWPIFKYALHGRRTKPIC